jgi:hypothetical protein
MIVTSDQEAIFRALVANPGCTLDEAMRMVNSGKGSSPHVSPLEPPRVEPPVLRDRRRRTRNAVSSDSEPAFVQAPAVCVYRGGSGEAETVLEERYDGQRRPHFTEVAPDERARPLQCRPPPNTTAPHRSAQSDASHYSSMFNDELGQAYFSNSPGGGGVCVEGEHADSEDDPPPPPPPPPPPNPPAGEIVMVRPEPLTEEHFNLRGPITQQQVAQLRMGLTHHFIPANYFHVCNGKMWKAYRRFFMRVKPPSRETRCDQAVVSLMVYPFSQTVTRPWFTGARTPGKLTVVIAHELAADRINKSRLLGALLLRGTDDYVAVMIAWQSRDLVVEFEMGSYTTRYGNGYNAQEFTGFKKDDYITHLLFWDATDLDPVTLLINPETREPEVAQPMRSLPLHDDVKHGKKHKKRHPINPNAAHAPRAGSVVIPRESDGVTDNSDSGSDSDTHSAWNYHHHEHEHKHKCDSKHENAHHGAGQRARAPPPPAARRPQSHSSSDDEERFVDEQRVRQKAHGGRRLTLVRFYDGRVNLSTKGQRLAFEHWRMTRFTDLGMAWGDQLRWVMHENTDIEVGASVIGMLYHLAPSLPRDVQTADSPTMRPMLELADNAYLSVIRVRYGEDDGFMAGYQWSVCVVLTIRISDFRGKLNPRHKTYESLGISSLAYRKHVYNDEYATIEVTLWIQHFMSATVVALVWLILRLLFLHISHGNERYYRRECRINTDPWIVMSREDAHSDSG